MSLDIVASKAFAVTRRTVSKRHWASFSAASDALAIRETVGPGNNGHLP